MSDELKPCPFCGSNNLVRSVDGGIYSDYFDQSEFYGYVVTCTLHCDKCGAQIQGCATSEYETDLFDAAVLDCYEKWNARADDAQVAANDNLSAETDISADGHARNDTETVDSLTAERDELRKERDRWHVEQVHAYGNWEDAHEYAKKLEAERDDLRERLKIQANSFQKLERELHEAKVESMHSQAQREELARLNAEKRGTRKLPKKVVWPRDEKGKPVKINALGAKNILFDSRTYLIEYWDGSTRYETYKHAKEALNAMEG